MPVNLRAPGALVTGGTSGKAKKPKSSGTSMKTSAILSRPTHIVKRESKRRTSTNVTDSSSSSSSDNGHQFPSSTLAKAVAKKKLQLNATEDGIFECDNTGLSIAHSFSVPSSTKATHSPPISTEVSPISNECPFLRRINLEQLETGEKISVEPSETTDTDKPRHTVGCTRHECHGAMMDKKGFSAVGDSYSQPLETKIAEAVAFLRQFAAETSNFATQQDLQDRIEDVTHDISAYGTYQHTYEELEFGCRLAWRNSGRCIMRKVSFNLELRDCRSANTSQECYEQIIEHLIYANNGGAIKPVISVFPQKGDGISAPVRIWNRQLIGYAAYKRKDGSVMGDPVNLSFTALCVKLGWIPPTTKSDFDILPLIISDKIVGHDRPRVFEIPVNAVLEVPIHHPEHELFSSLNLRWYALPAISNMGVDIGGVYYQTCPFNGWYQVTEIGRDFLDKQRYDLAEAVAIACGIQRSKIGVWRDDVQLQVHKAILHSFAKASVSLVDHHTASDSFIDFHKEEIGKRGKCPADWIWVTPPAGGSMTKVFHQEMVSA
jgi:nitric oxide synthase oxygenase domain/subunit